MAHSFAAHYRLPLFAAASADIAASSSFFAPDTPTFISAQRAAWRAQQR